MSPCEARLCPRVTFSNLPNEMQGRVITVGHQEEDVKDNSRLVRAFCQVSRHCRSIATAHQSLWCDIFITQPNPAYPAVEQQLRLSGRRSLTIHIQWPAQSASATVESDLADAEALAALCVLLSRDLERVRELVVQAPSAIILALYQSLPPLLPRLEAASFTIHNHSSTALNIIGAFPVVHAKHAPVLGSLHLQVPHDILPPSFFRTGILTKLDVSVPITKRTDSRNPGEALVALFDVLRNSRNLEWVCLTAGYTPFRYDNWDLDKIPPIQLPSLRVLTMKRVHRPLLFQLFAMLIQAPKLDLINLEIATTQLILGDVSGNPPPTAHPEVIGIDQVKSLSVRNIYPAKGAGRYDVANETNVFPLILRHLRNIESIKVTDGPLPHTLYSPEDGIPALPILRHVVWERPSCFEDERDWYAPDLPLPFLSHLPRSGCVKLDTFHISEYDLTASEVESGKNGARKFTFSRP